jgi:hypothetical protein
MVSDGKKDAKPRPPGGERERGRNEPLESGSFQECSKELVLSHRASRSRRAHRSSDYQSLLSWIRIVSQALGIDNLCSWNKTRAPCTRPGRETRPRDHTSWTQHYLTLRKRWPQFDRVCQGIDRILLRPQSFRRMLARSLLAW